MFCVNKQFHNILLEFFFFQCDGENVFLYFSFDTCMIDFNILLYTYSLWFHGSGLSSVELNQTADAGNHFLTIKKS